MPVYYDRRFHEHFSEAINAEQRFAQFDTATLGELIENDLLAVQAGHGSPGREERVGDVPYIKVSDLRAWLNINPTNRVPQRVAKKLWGGDRSTCARSTYFPRSARARTSETSVYSCRDRRTSY